MLRNQNISYPVVTVLIPVHNGEAYVGFAVDSILGQTLSDFELIVIDDGSTDDTARIIDSYHDPRLRLLTNDGCIGVSASRNRGLEVAAAPYVAFLDADDVAYPDRLEKQVTFLESHPDVVLVGCHLDYIDADGNFLFSENSCQRPCEPDKLRIELLRRACILPSTATGRKSALLEEGGFPAMDYAEDHDLWCRLAVKHDLAVMPDRLVAYRQHPNQATFKKILKGYRATRQCIELARKRFVAEGVLSPDDLPPPISWREYLTGSKGSLGALYLQWAELHTWALRQPGRGIILSAMALCFSPLNGKAWSVLLRSGRDLLLPSAISKRLSWYVKKLRSLPFRNG